MYHTNKIFVSYTLKDKELTIEHLKRLKTQVPLLSDTYIDILDNDSVDWQQRVNDELNVCDNLWLIATPHARKSIWVNHELKIMCNLQKKITPISVDSIDIVSKLPKMRHKVFISYHHANDQWAKDRLVALNEQFQFFIDASVDTGDIPEDWDDEKIRREIRDNYLRNSTVTLLLVGSETKNRKHVDWELFSSMYDGQLNKRSGIVVIMLPSTSCTSCHASFENEKTAVFPHINQWTSVTSRSEYERLYPFLPPRIIDQLMKGDVKISIANWDNLTVEKLALLIDNAANNRMNNNYDMSRQMRRRNN